MTLQKAIDAGEQVLSNFGEWARRNGYLQHITLDEISAMDALAVGYSEETPHGRRQELKRRDETRKQLYGATK